MAARPKRQKCDIPFESDDEIAVLVERFEQCRWPYERWTHRAHLAVAVFYLRRHSLAEALERMRQNIQRYNQTCGDPDGYHETITVLFLRWINHRLRDGLGDRTEAAVVDDLFRECDMRWPLEYYSPDRLWSAEARASWVEPDRKPLDF